MNVKKSSRTSYTSMHEILIIVALLSTTMIHAETIERGDQDTVHNCRGKANTRGLYYDGTKCVCYYDRGNYFSQNNTQPRCYSNVKTLQMTGCSGMQVVTENEITIPLCGQVPSLKLLHAEVWDNLNQQGLWQIAYSHEIMQKINNKQGVVQLNRTHANWEGLLLKLAYKCSPSYPESCAFIKFLGKRPYPLRESFLERTPPTLPPTTLPPETTTTSTTTTTTKTTTTLKPTTTTTTTPQGVTASTINEQTTRAAEQNSTTRNSPWGPRRDVDDRLFNAPMAIILAAVCVFLFAMTVTCFCIYRIRKWKKEDDIDKGKGKKNDFYETIERGGMSIPIPVNSVSSADTLYGTVGDPHYDAVGGFFKGSTVSTPSTDIFSESDYRVPEDNYYNTSARPSIEMTYAYRLFTSPHVRTLDQFDHRPSVPHLPPRPSLGNISPHNEQYYTQAK